MTRLLPPASPRPKAEPVVPMINVVFLLLIFFLMTASLTTPAPFRMVPPDTPGEAADPAPRLYVSSEGEIAFGGARGGAALDLAAGGGPVLLSADRDLPAADLARILAELARRGAAEVALITLGDGK